MNRGCFALSLSARRSSLMQEVSAESLTATSRQTARTRSSLATTFPGWLARKWRTDSDFGVTWSSRAPRVRPSIGCKQNGPNRTSTKIPELSHDIAGPTPEYCATWRMYEDSVSTVRASGRRRNARHGGDCVFRFGGSHERFRGEHRRRMECYGGLDGARGRPRSGAANAID